MNEPIHAPLADLVEDLNSPRALDIEDVMTRVVQFATEALGVTDGSIFLSHASSAGPLFESVVPTSPEVVKTDDLQHETGQGPSIDAVESDEPVIARDLARDPRWPLWRESAVGMGFAGVISVRLRARGRTIGALNLYSHEHDSMSVTDGETAKTIAQHIAAVMAAAIEQSTMSAALASRSVISRAQGLVMERYGITDDQAFELLKRISQNTNVKIREVAERLAAGDPLSSIDGTASPHA